MKTAWSVYSDYGGSKMAGLQERILVLDDEAEA